MNESGEGSSDSSSSSSTGSEAEECFLRSCRNGDLSMVRNMLEKRDAGQYCFDISCKGQSKSNLGWTPLHLATYFGHREVMEILLARNADINAVNDAGDTPLHKAAFIGREDLVMLLLQFNANVNIINGEGRLPRDMTPSNEAGQEIAKLLRAAEATEQLRKEGKLLTASREGNIELLSGLLKDENPPNINCVDAQGNSCLHCAAYRGHKETAVLLLQNGIDTSIRNNRGQLALDLARDAQTLQVLSVKAVRKVQKTANRYEGPLLKRSRFLGWKPVWAVLERGVLNYYASRADSTVSANKRRDYKYLDSARVTPLTADLSSFVVHFNDGAVHRLSVINNGDPPQVARQKWMNAFNEHSAYSSHYLWGNNRRKSDSDEEFSSIGGKPLGCMADALASATASFEVLQRQLGECAMLVEALQKSLETTDSSASLPMSAMMRFQLVSETAANMLSSLQHCLTLFHQQEDIRVIQLKQEQEKCRVLEEALNVLAKEHHELEQSVASHISETGTFPRSLSHKSPRIYDTDDDEFFDAFEADSDTDTLVTAESLFNSPSGSIQDLAVTHSRTSYTRSGRHLLSSERRRRGSNESNSSSGSSDTLVDGVSIASSCGTLFSQGGDAYRCARDEFIYERPTSSERKAVKRRKSDEEMRSSGFRQRQFLPVPMFSRNDFSIWSVLKNCIGKELSKITMPVIFNEPLSFLQRITEHMEYARLLHVAARQEDTVDRLKYVAAFAISALASNWDRLGKPFNPLLGETYELQRPEYRVVCEQVSHHPPVTAFHAESGDFIVHGSVHPKLKFWGKSVEIQPKGCVTVEFPKSGDAFTWSGVNCCVHNIIVGKLWMEHYGTMEITSHRTGHRAVVTLKPAGWASKDLHRVEGYIIDKNKKKLFFIYGKWTEFLKCTDQASYEEYFKENAHKFKRGDERSRSPNESPAHTPRKVLSKLNSLKMSSFKSLSVQESDDIPEPPDGEIPKCDSTYSIDIPNSLTLWEADARPENAAEYYQFTLFAMGLNELEPGMKPPVTLCPTDSRLRPDIRKLEEGDIDGAAAEKTRLEEKQRDARKARKGKKAEEWMPKWFTSGLNPHNKVEDWLYSGGYWDRNYDSLLDPDIF
ncbi:oxysterol-binding protein-related protein 1 isoform X2 [Phlebotomus argentipes]|uniref:oxysterol-binding protein-related protein 1 isoform X2 n=1 Tax=Phlebotomus argentipes TaxID=94469 RepID=UPI0028933B25|nr:oxysterol-binding protein-related protein 1 isoform X2 [Phlebotomus argentipes]